MDVKEIKNNIYYYGSSDPDRQYFDQLIPLPNGTSYNSYLVVGSEKTALIDTVYPPQIDEFLEKLRKNGIKKIDYVIANHGEQDHSGALPELIKMYPDIKIVTNKTCKEFLMELLLIDEDKFIVVQDNEELSLGGKTLKFIMAPWVHWPDTMFTYVKEDGILFSCDFFGSHLADETLYVEDEKRVYDAAKRYYAEIMMPFVRIFKKYFAVIDELDIKMICASHGPIYQNPSFIINAYKDWAKENSADKTVIIHVSMYGSTNIMLDYVTQKLQQNGVEVCVYDVMNCDLGNFAMDLIDATGVIIATPMVLGGPHPAVVSYTYIVNALRPQIKYVGIMGSYNWGGFMEKKIKNLLEDMRNIEFIKPLLIKGHPKQKDYPQIDEFVSEILKQYN
ncbi:MAG: FprA family A-type flavoprotein [Candidatus Gastranaerophilaceae bacterium]|jgi:flavorubredoxin